ncbi:hypothetical protein BDZ89DRAFT_921128, partial [Hymenopellis radicata]
EQCALNEDGTLKDASEIEFVHDPDDEGGTSAGAPGRGHRQKNLKRLHDGLAEEQKDEYGNIRSVPASNRPKRQKRSSRRSTTGKEKAVDVDMDEDENSAVDGDYTDDGDPSESDEDVEMGITNEELANSLPTKTVPLTSKPSKH